jgi:hypothetical protein
MDSPLVARLQEIADAIKIHRPPHRLDRPGRQE